VSLNAREKSMQNSGKGQNETLEIVNPLENTRAATTSVDGHVPKNGGTCIPHFPVCHKSKKQALVSKKCPKRKFNAKMLLTKEAVHLSRRPGRAKGQVLEKLDSMQECQDRFEKQHLRVLQ
jgi:hypothetical protein